MSTPSKREVLSSAQEALSGAKRQIEDAEAKVNAALKDLDLADSSGQPEKHTAGESPPSTGELSLTSSPAETQRFDKAGGSPPSTSKKLVLSSSPDPSDKENFAGSDSNLLKSGEDSDGAAIEVVAPDTIVGEAKSPSSSTSVKKVIAQTLKKVVVKSPESKGNDVLMTKSADCTETEEVLALNYVIPYRSLLQSIEDEGWSKQKQWIKSMRGSLIVYRNKSTGKAWFVQRNVIGIIKLNLDIEQIKCLEKVRKEIKKKGRKPKEVAYVGFYAIADKDTGYERFLLKVKPENVDNLFEKLKELGAQVKA